MIQELTDCGPSKTYPVYYLEDAMNNLGDCFDYAVNDYGTEGIKVAELFCLSGVAREFERGNALSCLRLLLKGQASKRDRCQTAPTDLRRHRNTGQAGYWHTCSGVWGSLSKTCCTSFRLMSCATCTTPGTKSRKNAWLALSATWRRKRLARLSWH